MCKGVSFVIAFVTDIDTTSFSLRHFGIITIIVLAIVVVA
jgi:hypothetical protein